MLNKGILMVLVLCLAGCTYEGKKIENYIEAPAMIIEDPHYAQYQERLSALESEYLKKKITYAQYLEQKNKIHETYNKEVQKRTSIITSTND